MFKYISLREMGLWVVYIFLHFYISQMFCLFTGGKKNTPLNVTIKKKTLTRMAQWLASPYPCELSVFSLLVQVRLPSEGLWPKGIVWLMSWWGLIARIFLQSVTEWTSWQPSWLTWLPEGKGRALRRELLHLSSKTP